MGQLHTPEVGQVRVSRLHSYPKQLQLLTAVPKWNDIGNINSATRLSISVSQVNFCLVPQGRDSFATYSTSDTSIVLE